MIAASVALAHALVCRLRVVWTRTPDLNARFSDLFRATQLFDVTESSWTASRLRRHLLRNWVFDEYQTDEDLVPMIGQPEALVAGLAESRRPFLITCRRYYPGKLPRSTLPAVADIESAVQEATRGFTPNTVGVHIRRSDQGLAIKESPTTAFLEAMRLAIRRAPETTFFLATDSPAEAKEISGAFPGRVTTLRPNLQRVESDSARGALIDMECLGRCRYVLGSFFSSFSEVAAERGEVPLEVVRASSALKA